MSRLIDWVKNKFSTRVCSIVIVFISALVRSIQQIHFLKTLEDKIYQIQATKNLWEGHGYTLFQVAGIDFSSVVYSPLVRWPPGYSILLLPFYAVFKENFFWGTLCLDTVTSVLFVYVARKFILLFNLPLYAANLYTLVTGFFMYVFCSSSTTDFITLLFYISAFYLTLKFLSSPGKKIALPLSIAFLIFYCDFLRYMYIPVSVVIPMYLIVFGYIRKNKLVFNRGLFIFLVFLTLEGSFLLIQKQLTGQATYIEYPQKMFSPGNFLNMDPFLFSSFLNINFFCVQIEKTTGISFSQAFSFFQKIHLLVFTTLFVLSILWIFRKKMRVEKMRDHYMHIGILSSIAFIILIVYLSITRSPVQRLGNIPGLLFIQEGRYFAFITFFMQQIIFIAFFTGTPLKKYINFILKIVLAILFIGTLHGIYYSIKVIVKPCYVQDGEITLLDYSRKLLANEIKKNNEKKVILYSTDEVLGNYGPLWQNIPAFYKNKKVEAIIENADKNIVLFTAILDKDSVNLNFLRKNFEKKLIGTAQHFYFYSIDIESAR